VKFATAHNKPTLYHETITRVFLLLIRERMARSGPEQTWAEFFVEQSGSVDLEGQHLEKILPRGDPLVSPGAKHISAA
jgi:hypothetical protein